MGRQFDRRLTDCPLNKMKYHRGLGGGYSFYRRRVVIYRQLEARLGQLDELGFK